MVFKKIVKKAADHDQRSLVNMLEVPLGGCRSHKGILSLDQHGPRVSVHNCERVPAERRASAGAAP